MEWRPITWSCRSTFPFLSFCRPPSLVLLIHKYFTRTMSLTILPRLAWYAIGLYDTKRQANINSMECTPSERFTEVLRDNNNCHFNPLMMTLYVLPINRGWIQAMMEILLWIVFVASHKTAWIVHGGFISSETRLQRPVQVQVAIWGRFLFRWCRKK